MIRLAHSEDIPSLKMLWKKVFGDTELYIDYFMKTVFPTVEAVVYELNGIHAMLFLVPYALMGKQKEEKIHYVYAVAVDEQCRNQGIMRKMLDFAYQYSISNGYYGHILIPATPSLFQLYEKNGFVNFSNKFLFDSSNLETYQLTSISIEEYLQLRPSFLQMDGNIVASNVVAQMSLFGIDSTDIQPFQWKKALQTGICIMVKNEMKEFLGTSLLPYSESPYTMIKTPYELGFSSPYFYFGMD